MTNRNLVLAFFATMLALLAIDAAALFYALPGRRVGHVPVGRKRSRGLCRRQALNWAITSA